MKPFNKACVRLCAVALCGACLGPWDPVAAQALPAGMEGMTSTRGMIGMMRDLLANQARQMAASGQALDIEQMFNQAEAGGGAQGLRKAEPVDSTLQTLPCPALAARVTKVDAAIEAKLAEDEQRQTAVEAKIAATNAENAAAQKAKALACNANPLSCLTGALLGRGADAATGAQARANAAEVKDLSALRAGFDPLLRERMVAVYHLERKACK
jgi:hypothetical protein